MFRDYFWGDALLRIVWYFREIPDFLVIAFFLCAAFSFEQLFRRYECRYCLVESIIPLLSCIICIFFLIAVPLSRHIYPIIFSNSPNTPFKEELRMADIVQGSTVWIIKRNDLNEPTSVDEHVVIAKNTESVIVQVLTNDDSLGSSSNTTMFMNFSIKDCYANKNDAYAAIESELRKIFER